MIEILGYVGVAAIPGLSILAVILALRNSGLSTSNAKLRVDAADADEKRRMVEVEFKTVADEFREYKRKKQDQLLQCREDVESLRSSNLAKMTTEEVSSELDKFFEHLEERE